MRNRVHAAMATAVLLAVTLAGCGASKDGAEIPSAGNDDPSATTSPSETSREGGSRHDMLLKLAQCLRDHGLDVEDPEPGEGVQIQAAGPNKAKADAAQRACEKYAPPGEEDAEAEREDMLETAQCMRDHGVEAFPDPKPGEGIGIDEKVATDPDFTAAEKECMGDADTNKSGGQ